MHGLEAHASWHDARKPTEFRPLIHAAPAEGMGWKPMLRFPTFYAPMGF